MSSVFNDIQNALNTCLNGIAGLPTIFFPNSLKEPTQNTSYIAPMLLPARSVVYTLNNENSHSGIYQVDIYTVLKRGTATTLSIADSIRDGFNRQRLTVNGTVVNIQQISVSQSQRVESWWHCYVEINYLCVA